MTFPKDILALAQSVVFICAEKKIVATTAESCTGGLVAAAITEIPGASAAFTGGFVTYSNFLKTKALGVSGVTLETYGAVSDQTAREMVKGALKTTGADIGIAVTGIAGPEGGTKEKPVGLVHFASARQVGNNIHTYQEKHRFPGKARQDIRWAAVKVALVLLEAEAKHY